jgi:hypothetical protein
VLQTIKETWHLRPKSTASSFEEKPLALIVKFLDCLISPFDADRSTRSLPSVGSEIVKASELLLIAEPSDKRNRTLKP